MARNREFATILPEDGDTLETTLRKLLYAFCVVHADQLIARQASGQKVLTIAIGGVPVNLPIKLDRARKVAANIPVTPPEPS